MLQDPQVSCNRRPRSWLGGKLRPCITDRPAVDSSALLSLVPGLIDLAGEPEYLLKRAGAVDPTVFSVFNEYSFNGIKKNVDNYINRFGFMLRSYIMTVKRYVFRCVALWISGNRPCALMFKIPSPMEVLRQQVCSAS